jgi:pimeloyl-ACP methyl ester carboxylesterase
MKPHKLILLHGALGTASQWLPYATELADQFEIHAPEFEGHGATPAPERPFRIAHFAGNLACFILENRLAPASIFGHSMGGAVALHLARTQPVLIGSVMTLGTKFAWTPESAARETKMLDPATIAEKVPAFAAALERRHTALGWRTMLARTAEMMEALGGAPPLSDDDLAAILQPACIGIGEWDSVVSIDESAHAASALPNGILRLFPETAHPLEKVNKAALLVAIRQFFH